MDSRFARHILIPNWKQSSLDNATVIIVGVGALGNEVARMLAMSGVGHLILCDPDVVSLSNLSRCALFQETDVGRLKVEAAAQTLRTLAPHTVVDIRPLPLVQGIGLAELRDAALIFSCLDSRSARLQLAGRCNLVNAPCIDGGTLAWGGEVRPFLQASGPCYACALSEMQRAVADIPVSCVELVEDENAVGATIASTALVASWMSLIGLRFLMGLPYTDAIIRFDGGNGRSDQIQQQRNPSCPLHQPISNSRLIPVDNYSTLKTLLDSIGHDKIVLLWEAIQCRVECYHCGFTQEHWGIPRITPCPSCNVPLTVHTVLDCAMAPHNMCLADFGIAPREILAIRNGSKIEWIELSSNESI